MARPRVRTATLPDGDVAKIKETFGTVSNAFERLRPKNAKGEPMRERTFTDAASGRPVRPEDLAAFARAWAAWRQAHLK